MIAPITWTGDKPTYEVRSDVPEREFFGSFELGDGGNRRSIDVIVQSDPATWPIQRQHYSAPGKLWINSGTRVGLSGHEWTFDGSFIPDEHSIVPIRGSMNTQTGKMSNIIALHRKRCAGFGNPKAHSECQQDRLVEPEDLFCSKCGSALVAITVHYFI